MKIAVLATVGILIEVDQDEFENTLHGDETNDEREDALSDFVHDMGWQAADSLIGERLVRLEYNATGTITFADEGGSAEVDD